VTFNPATIEAFSSQGDGTLTVIKENSPTDFVVEQTVATPARAKTLTLDTKTNNILLITAEYGPTPAAPPALPGASSGTPTPEAGAGRTAGCPRICGTSGTDDSHSFQIVVVGSKPGFVRDRRLCVCGRDQAGGI